MAYYEGDPNQQNGQDFNQQPQGQPNQGAAQPENQFNQNASQTQGQQFQQQANQGQQFQQQANQGQQFQQQANQGQQFQQNQQFNQGQPNYQQSYNQPVNNYVDTGHSPVQIMVFGIVSLASSVLFSYTVILGVLSIVFGALAMSWSKKFNEANPGNNDGQVKAGRVCGIIGLIVGIVGMVVGLIVFLTVGCAACFASMGGYGY